MQESILIKREGQAMKLKQALNTVLIFAFLMVFISNSFASTITSYDTSFSDITLHGQPCSDIESYTILSNDTIYGSVYYHNWGLDPPVNNTERWFIDNNLVVPSPNLNTSLTVYFGFWLKPYVSSSGAKFAMLWINTGTADYIQLYFVTYDGTNWDVSLMDNTGSCPNTPVVAASNTYWLEFGMKYDGVWNIEGYINGSNVFGNLVASLNMTVPTMRLAYMDTEGNNYTLGNWKMWYPLFEYGEQFPPTNYYVGSWTPEEPSIPAIPEHLAVATGLSVLAAGLLCGLMLELACVLPVLIFTDNPLVITIFAIIGLCLGVALGWMPYVTLILIILIIALLYADKIRGFLTGGDSEK